MTLSAGARLGPYEVHSAIGAGGMGEVYRARDSKLNRDVALKVLPDSFANDAERLARFKREAQVLASLNHPNIAIIHGLEESGGVRALVLELVEGPTLADLISAGTSRAEALPIARQIAEALEAAHEHGVVHRDLKPANIKVRDDGTVKVLDFGLAKLTEAGAGSNEQDPAYGLSQSPTITSPAATRLGVIMGTAAYMSPEQAKGRAVDKRADIWAFGCVLYEMITGKRAFDGDDVSEVLAAVIKSDPAWSALPAGTPAKLRALLQRCLQKDPKQRLRDIGDARLDLQEAQAPPDAEAPGVAPAGRRTRERLAWALVVILALVAVAAVALGAMAYFSRGSIETQALRFFVSPPDGWILKNTVTEGAGGSAPLTVSPDGSRLAFVATGADGKDQIWIRSLDTLAAQTLTGTDGAASPFWSPDSRFLGFFADGKLKKIDVSGGPPITLCEAPNARGGTWSRDGIIVFAPSNDAALQKVSAAGGVPTAATTLTSGEAVHLRPSFLPDGRHFLYSVRAGGPVYVASLDSTDRTLLLEASDSTNVLYAQNHLLFLRGTTLMAQPFDAGRLALVGEAVPIAEQVQTQANLVVGDFSVSENGVLAYQTGTAGGNSRLIWFDRAGKQIGAFSDQANYADVELSPDNKRAAVSVNDPARRTRDIWLYDVARELRTLFTFDPGNDQAPIWSPDGSRIVFDSDRKGLPDLYAKASTGAGSEEVILQGEGVQRAFSWSHDGRYILYQSGTTPRRLFSLPVVGDLKPFQVLEAPSPGLSARFSPDGRWVAYTSSESGRVEVYVAPFPKADGKWRVSTAGGSFSRWRQDGNEIFYMEASGMLMAASVQGRGATFQIGEVRPLFQMRTSLGRYPYDVSSDGQRFLVATSIEESSAAPITVVVNWTAGLGK